MCIEFETPKPIAQQQYVLQTVAENMMRSVSREMDENEHAVPYGYIEFMHAAMNRITSYNVCYTKLLRTFLFADYPR